MGDHVKVIAGRYEGDTGLIVRVEENFVILFSDLTMHEVGFTIKLWKTTYRKSNIVFFFCLKCCASVAVESFAPGPAAVL